MSSFLSCATTALALFLLGVAFLISLNVRFLLTVVQSEMEIQAYLKTEVSDEQGQQAMEAIRKLPGVSDASYVSKDMALEELKQVFQDDAYVLEGLGDGNPLSASIRVKTAEAADVPKVAEEIGKIEAVEEVDYQEGLSLRLASLARASQYVSLGGMLVVGLVAIMVIGNSIRLTIDARRHEIGIMKLVGATDEFIMGPFLLQGMVLGIIGGLVGEGLVASLYVWAVRELEGILPFIPTMKLTMRTAMDMMGVMLVTGVAVGTVGSVLSLRRHLRV